MILGYNSRSAGFEDIEGSLIPSQPDGQRKTTAGMAGGRGGRVVRRNDSLKATGGSEETSTGTGRGRTGSASADLTEADRPRYKQLVEDTKNLINWFNADPIEGEEMVTEMSLSDFKDACRSLGKNEQEVHALY